jgi:hypothetical protein
MAKAAIEFPHACRFSRGFCTGYLLAGGDLPRFFRHSLSFHTPLHDLMVYLIDPNVET